MKNCTHCKHADWHRTKAGTLHPRGDGMCKYEYKLPPLPASMYWLSYMTPIAPRGGNINRRKELWDHCVYWARSE